MNSSNPPDGPLPALQFGDAEPVGSEPEVQGLNCVICTLPIEATYFALGDQVICPSCKDVVSAPPKGSGFVRFAKATCFGTAAGLVGAVIWYLIRIIAHLEIGLVAILVGFMVGKAVHKASSGKGGFVYQALAVLITYVCISANYMPDVFQGIMNSVPQQIEGDVAGNAKDPATAPAPDQRLDESNSQPTESTTENVATVPADQDVPAEQIAQGNAIVPAIEENEPEMGPAGAAVMIILVAVFTVVLSLAMPVMIGIENPIGLLIVGFALWEAWKFSAHRPLPITGPYQVGNEAGSVTGAVEPSV